MTNATEEMSFYNGLMKAKKLSLLTVRLSFIIPLSIDTLMLQIYFQEL
jgi:hypothetical protein